MSEFEENDELDVNQFKRYTGNDSIPVRTHQQKEMEYIIAPPITFSLNSFLKMDTTGNSMKRRIICVEFGKTFTTQSEYDKLESKVNILVCDPTLKKKVEDDEVKCIIMNIMIQYYKRYCDEGLKAPQSIVDDTKMFLSNTSAVGKWLEDELEKCCSQNVYKSDLLDYLNAQLGKYLSPAEFAKVLGAHGYECCNSSGVRLQKDESKAWYLLHDRKKGMVVKGVKMRKLSTKIEEQLEDVPYFD